jgi:hypothetical protein
MKKLIQNNPRGLTAAIAVLACCTGAANATVEQSKGTNAIAFTEQRGDRSANLVLSTLDLAMMDPVERDNMLASLETQFGKPKAWASRAGRSTSTSVFGFARDGDKEKYGVRLRARQALPSFNSDLAQVVPAEKLPAALEDMASADLLGVERSEVLTWSANQDDYLTGSAIKFKMYSFNKWINPGFNYKWPLDSDILEGVYSAMTNGVQFKVKQSLETIGRLEYNQWWYKQQYQVNNVFYDSGPSTRNVTASATLALRNQLQLAVNWGHDWNLNWAGYWGLGLEFSVSGLLSSSGRVTMTSSNTSDFADTFEVEYRPSFGVEAQGTAWIGNTEHKAGQNFWEIIYPSEGHKILHGAKAQIVFEGSVGLGIAYKCTEYDWCNDHYNDKMEHNMKVGNLSASGKVTARAEFRWGDASFQNGYQIWSGEKSVAAWEPKFSSQNIRWLDLLL